jgi:tetratricopeptide (TPR) repeat protein
MRHALIVALVALTAAAPRARAVPALATRADAYDTTCDPSYDTSYGAVVRRAERASIAGRWSEAAELWRWALTTDDRTPEHWQKLGTALFNANRHRESIAAFERALQLGTVEPAAAAWQISRAYAHRGNRTQALRWLTQAVALGFDRREAVRREPLFGEYRTDPRFAGRGDAASTGHRPLPHVPAA